MKLQDMRYRMAIVRGTCDTCGSKGDTAFLCLRKPEKRRAYICAACILETIDKPEETDDNSQSDPVQEVPKTAVQKATSPRRKGRGNGSGNKAQRD